MVLEGVPAGIRLTQDCFISDLERRRPQLRGETPRREEDIPIVEGLNSDGVTTGEAVISALVITPALNLIHDLRMPTWCNAESMALNMTSRVEVWLRGA